MSDQTKGHLLLWVAWALAFLVGLALLPNVDVKIADKPPAVSVPACGG